MDEEDNLWLNIINDQLLHDSQSGIQIAEEQFEAIMDCFEKEAHSICTVNEFENQANRTIDGLKFIFQK